MVVVTFSACQPNSVTSEEHVERAQQFRTEGDLRSAVIELKNALQKAPEDAQARALLGDTYLSLGQATSAVKELGRARELGLNTPDTLLSHAKSLLLVKDYAGAKKLVDDNANHTDEAWLLVRGQAEFGLGNHEQSAATFAEIVSADARNTAALRGLARTSQVLNDSDTALAHVARAITANDAEISSWLLKAEIELTTNAAADAIDSYEKALAISPNEPRARIGLARALLSQNDTDGAAAQIAKLPENARSRPMVHYLDAIIARNRKDLEKALRSLREVRASNPEHDPSLLLLGQVHYARGEFELAVDALGRYLKRVPRNLDAVKAYAAVQLELDQPEAANEALQALPEDAKRDPQVLTLLGATLVANRKHEEGNELLEQAVAADPNTAAIRAQRAVGHLASGETEAAISELEAALEIDPRYSRADYLLIITRLKDKQYELALTAAESLAEKQGDDPATMNLLGATLEANDKIDEAKAAYARAAELKPDYRAPLLNLARLGVRDGDANAARGHYQTILENETHDPQALIALAKLAAQEGNSEDGLALLARAHKHNPKALQPKLILASYHLRLNQAEQALIYAREAVQTSKRNPAALLVLGRAQLASGDAKSARTTLAELTSLSPNSAEARYQLALAERASGNADESAKRLLETLELDPKHLGAQLAHGNAVLKAGDPKEALAVAKRVQETAKGKVSGLILEGDSWSQVKQHDRAIEAYRSAMRGRATSGVVLKLFTALRRAGKEADADALISNWLESKPGDESVRLVAASALQSKGSNEEAAVHYEAVLASSPTNIFALNNLAWIYAELGREDSMQLAARAYELAPDRAEVLDTYGWLLVRANETERGLSLLERAKDRAPNNPDIRYHHAAALAKAGDAAQAKEALRTLLETTQAFSEREDAQRLLDEL